MQTAKDKRSKTTDSQTKSEAVVVGEINPLFADKIGRMLRELAQHYFASKEISDKAKVLVADIRSHITFEREKLALEADKMQWKDRVTASEKLLIAEMDRKRLHLDMLLADFPAEGVEHVTDFLDRFFTRICETFPDFAGEPRLI